MKTVKKIVFFFILPLLALVTGLGFIVSNAIRPLSNPDVEMTEMAVMDLKQKISENDSLSISKGLQAIKGVSTFSLNRESSLLAISYFPETVDCNALYSTLKKEGFNPVPKVFPVDASVKKCPIPTSWLYKVSTLFRF